MKAIMLMFDSLNRHMLAPYGCDWTHTPNFKRLAERTVVFDNCWIGSMPCMPARRDLHTGRYNFLHRSWGPLEPFDNSFPELLKNNGIHTHLITDHQHYWEDGGATYHNRYSTYELNRGQEGDLWKGVVHAQAAPEQVAGHANQTYMRQDAINRSFMKEEQDFPQAKTFQQGLEFMYTNADSDSWFLQVETFDPHEPFFAPQQYRDLYPHDYTGKPFDWPAYRQVQESPEEVAHCRYEYAALLSMCDAYLGRVLDAMDELDLWKDTMLIVNTDHGFLLGEHDWWAKVVQPFYNEVARTPLMIWDPRSGKQGERRRSLVQMIDMAPTLLDYFNVEVPEHVQGKALAPVIENDTPLREAVLFGIHGGHVNYTDGRHVYMKAPVHPDNQPLYEYTLMPTHMRGFFEHSELAGVTLSEPFSFTRQLKTLKTEARPKMNAYTYGKLLFDLDNDPKQEHPLSDEQTEQKMLEHIQRLMKESDAPVEQYTRLGMEQNKSVR